MKLKQRFYLSVAIALVAVAALNVDLIAQAGRMITTTGVVYVRAFMGAFAIQNNTIGTTSTRGLSVENVTAASAGAQQYSPMLCQEGQGWKTDATAGSQSVEFCWEVQPVQGTSAPTGNLILKASINGGAFSTVGTFTSAGILSVAELQSGTTSVNSSRISAPEIVAATSGYIYWSGRSLLTAPSDGAVRITNSAETNTYDITLADWGTTLSAESVSVANDAALTLGASSLGQLVVTVGTENTVCRFTLRGSSTAVLVDDDGDTGSGAVCTLTKDNASTLNVYYDTTGYFLQNKLGGTRAVRLTLIGA